MISRKPDLFKQPPHPHVTIDPIEVQASYGYCELIFDVYLGTGFDAGGLGE